MYELNYLIPHTNRSNLNRLKKNANTMQISSNKQTYENIKKNENG